MTSYFECTFDWLQVRCPHLLALWSAILLGTFGLGSLTLLLWVLAPGSLVTWMPLILFFCAANAGYNLVQKRNQDFPSQLTFYIIALSGWFFILASAVQYFIDTHLFNTSPSALIIIIFATCAGIGVWAGQRLRMAYENLQGEKNKRRKT